MAYTKTNWEDSPSTNTPINAANLNKMERGIFDAHRIMNTHPNVYIGTAEWNDEYSLIDVSVSNLDVNNILMGDIFIFNFNKDAVLKKIDLGKYIIAVRINTNDIQTYILNMPEDITVVAGDYMILNYVKHSSNNVFVVQYFSNKKITRQIEDIKNQIGDINALLDIINGEVI